MEEAAGLLVPEATLEKGRLSTRWIFCLQEAGGRRWVHPYAEQLTLPTGRCLFFQFTPGPPATFETRWSQDGIARWLAGYTPDAAGLYRDLRSQIVRHVVFPEELAAALPDLIALWIVLAYCYRAWPAIPYLHIRGPLGSGKTRLLDLLSRLAWRPVMASSITAAALIRILDQHGGTLLLDEAERLNGNSGSVQELKTALLDGYKTSGKLYRAEKRDGGFQPVAYDVYGPKALGRIADVPPALASR